MFKDICYKEIGCNDLFSMEVCLRKLVLRKYIVSFIFYCSIYKDVLMRKYVVRIMFQGSISRDVGLRKCALRIDV